MVTDGGAVDAIVLEGLFKVFGEKLAVLVKVVTGALWPLD